MNARTSRLATLLLILLSLGGISFAAPMAKPAVVRTPAQEARSAKMSALAKTRDRNEKGQFLPKVSNEAVSVRAYQKWQASGSTNGHDQQDWSTAKRELQDEKMADNKAARAAATVK